MKFTTGCVKLHRENDIDRLQGTCQFGHADPSDGSLALAGVSEGSADSSRPLKSKILSESTQMWAGCFFCKEVSWHFHHRQAGILVMLAQRRIKVVQVLNKSHWAVLLEHRSTVSVTVWKVTAVRRWARFAVLTVNRGFLQRCVIGPGRHRERGCYDSFWR